MGTNDDIKGIVRKRDIFHGAADKGIAVGLGEIFGLLYIQPVYGVSADEIFFARNPRPLPASKHTEPAGI